MTRQNEYEVELLKVAQETLEADGYPLTEDNLYAAADKVEAELDAEMDREEFAKIASEIYETEGEDAYIEVLEKMAFEILEDNDEDFYDEDVEDLVIELDKIAETALNDGGKAPGKMKKAGKYIADKFRGAKAHVKANPKSYGAGAAVAAGAGGYALYRRNKRK